MRNEVEGYGTVGLRLALCIAVAVCLLLSLYGGARDSWAGSHFAAAAVIFFAASRDSTRAPIAAAVAGSFVAIVCLALEVDVGNTTLGAATSLPHLAAVATVDLACGLGIGCASVSVWLGTAKRSLFSPEAGIVFATLLFPVYLTTKRVALRFLMVVEHASYDRLLTRVDRAMGADISFVAGRFLEANPPLHQLVTIAYWVLPVAIAATFAFRRARARARGEWRILTATAVTGLLAFACYAMVPAAGPRFQWSEFPFFASSSVDPVPAPLPGVFFNAMPSVHFACALLIALDLWTWAGVAGRILGLAFAGLTALATLGLGEHYAVDLIVAVPFAAFVHIAVYSSERSRIEAAVCGAMTVAWLLSFRFASGALLAPGVAVAAAVATVAMTARLIQRAHRLGVFERVHPSAAGLVANDE